MISMEVIVGKDLTARNAVSFVQQANQFHSQLKIFRGNHVVVDAKSILGLMTLSLKKGARIVITAQGNDEREAVDALIKAIEGETQSLTFLPQLIERDPSGWL